MASSPLPEASPSMLSSQYPISQISPPTSTPSDEIASLPDSAPSDDIDDEDDDEDDEEELSDAERQWQESLQQIELLLTMVVVPYAGKYFGRRFAYWAWARFMQWQHPDVEVVFTNKKAFKVAGAVEAAASL